MNLGDIVKISVENIGIGKISVRVQKTSYQQYQQISASIKNA